MKIDIFNKIRQINKIMLDLYKKQADIKNKIAETEMLLGKILINQMKSQGIQESIQDVEFRVFSQFGDDGIIQYLLHHLKIEPHLFIEFGVENYTESNTRFLLINNNWKGFVIDGNKENIDYIKQDNIYWKYDLTAVHAFINRDNINDIFLKNTFSGEIGILSIDIDGNDYWIWDSINVIEPVLVIVEYNSLFGDKYAITVPYASDFMRTKVHYSNLYWGASLNALCLLAKRKGYYFIGSNNAGNNAYFVRKNRIGQLKPLSVEEGYVKSKYRESRDREGRLTYLSGNQCLSIIEDMPIYDVERNTMVKIREVLNERGD